MEILYLCFSSLGMFVNLWSEIEVNEIRFQGLNTTQAIQYNPIILTLYS